MAIGSVWDKLMITGGTGTFGRAFTRRVLDDNLASRIVIFSRDECKQEQMRVDFNNDARLRFRMGDVRNYDRLVLAMDGVEAVVHAAALKRVDRSADDLAEFIATNVTGTQNVIMAAHATGVKRVVVLSTDKAVNAVTPYGATKALAEWIAVLYNVYGPTRSCAVRYGNIVGSRGSVLETWHNQVASGCAISIVDPQMTRFWLPVERAVDLVLLALRRTGGGEVFIPKDVPRSTVMDLARQHFPDAPYRVTGKRAYEKTHETLVSGEEVDRLRDVGDCFVLLPHTTRWEPGPYGVTCGSPVGESFQYRSCEVAS